MVAPVHSHLFFALKLILVLAGVSALLLVGLALANAMLGLEVAKNLILGWPQMALGAALVPILAGVSLWLLRQVNEHQRAEEVWRQSQEELADLFENATVALHLVGPDGQILRANQAELDLLGYTREEYIGRHIAEFHADQAAIAEILRRLHQGETLDDYETRLRAKDGSIKQVAISSSVCWKEGQFIHTRCFTRDITEHKHAAEALRESEERFRVMADSAPVMLWVAGADKLCNFFNQGWLDFTGRTLRQELGNGWAEGVHADDYEQCLRTYLTAFDARQEFKMEYRLRRRDSAYRWILDHGVPRFLPDGSFAGYIGSAIDITERKQSEESRQQSEAQLAGIIGSAMDAIITVDEEQRITLFNAAAEQMFDRPAAEAIGQSLERLIPERFRQAPHEQIPDFGQTHVTKRRMESLIYGLRANGEEFPIEASISQIEISGQKFYTVILRDITERKQAEEEHALLLTREQKMRALAEEAEIRYHNLVHGLDAVVWEADAATFQVSFVSRRAEEMLGYPIERWSREPEFWVKLIYPEDRERVVTLYREASAAGRDHNLEYRVVAADGRTVWLYDKVYVVRDAEGQARQLRGLMVDITQRKRTEEEHANLLVREQEARAAAEYSAETVRRLQALTDSALAHLSLDELLREMLSRVCELLGADSATTYLLSEDRQELAVCSTIGLEKGIEAGLRVPVGQGIAGRIAETRAPLAVDDLSQEDAVGSILHQEMRSLIGAPLLIEGRVIGVIDAATTELRHFSESDLRLLQLAADRVALAIEHTRLYEAEQAARQQAETASRMKDEFLATVSHELRSPLNAILGWAKLLREGKLDATVTARALETIERSARSQSRIINDLLDVSRIISGKLPLNVRPIEPAQFVEAAIETVRPAAEAKEISLQAVLDFHAGPISGDSDRLQQIVWNLVSNAIKFTPKGGRVQVRLERANSHLEIIVSDTGTGINPLFLPYVFDRFRQADSSSTRKHGGLGLGLAIVRHLVELHGGTIQVESPGEGHGATFVVKLPLMISHAPALNSERVHPAVEGELRMENPIQLNGLRLLVVDDDADAREVLSTILAQSGAEVKTAASGAASLDLMTEWWPDVLLSDIEMPEENGYELIRQVRAIEAERGGHTPAVALTAYTRVEDRLRALAAGFQMHMPKPVDPVELVAVVASLAGRIGRKELGQAI